MFVRKGDAALGRAHCTQLRERDGDPWGCRAALPLPLLRGELSERQRRACERRRAECLRLWPGACWRECWRQAEAGEVGGVGTGESRGHCWGRRRGGAVVIRAEFEVTLLLDLQRLLCLLDNPYLFRSAATAFLAVQRMKILRCSAPRLSPRKYAAAATLSLTVRFKSIAPNPHLNRPSPPTSFG